MNRLIALKQNKNDSLLSNASTHDGYETAMDDTMGSTSVSMYFSMNESNVSLDKTIEAAAVDESQQQTHGMNVDDSIVIPEQCTVLQPIVSSNCLSPAPRSRKSLTSTPLSKRNADNGADADSSSPKQTSFVTVRKIAIGDSIAGTCDANTENIENMSVCEQNDDESQKSGLSIGDLGSNLSAVTETAQTTNELSGVDLMDVSETPTAENNATVSIDSLVAVDSQPAVHDVQGGDLVSLTSTFRQQTASRRRTTVARGGIRGLATIGEVGSGKCDRCERQHFNVTNCFRFTESTTLIEPQMHEAVAAAAAAAAVPSRRLTRRSLAVVAPANVRASPAARQRGRSSLASITPRKTASQRRSIVVHVKTPRTAAGIGRTAGTAAAPAAGTRRRSMATVMAAAAAVSASPLRAVNMRARKSIVASTSTAAPVAASASNVRTRRSLHPVASEQPPTVTVTAAAAVARVNSVRRSIAPARAAKAVTPRKVIASTAAAVLALNPTRRRASIRPTTPARRRSTLAVPKPRTPRRVKSPQQQLPPQQPRHHSVMPAPVAAVSNYFACPRCDRTFLQQSRLTTHLRTHDSAAPVAPVCQHCHRVFDKPIALSNHLLEHCAKIGVAERRRLLQKRDREDKEAAGSSSSATAVAKSGRSATAAAAAARGPAKLRVNSPSRAHRGVFHTPNKTIKCNECTKQFADPVSFALHVPTHRA